MINQKYINRKRYIDTFLALLGLIMLSPVFLILIIAIKLDSPGPVLFKQKRVGIYKRHFNILKFRTMRIDTPKDMPTHLLENPDQYITKVGKLMRKTSLDELPQIINILRGEMAVIGPRPALWNQYDLIEERDRYHANDVLPGLTGWAQIHGRDELEIPEKAKLDGHYVEHMSHWMDLKCFFGTIFAVLRSDGVVEGGTGEMKKQLDLPTSICRNYTYGKSDDEIIGHIGFAETAVIDRNAHKKVLITGAGSYIGEMFSQYSDEHYPDNFTIDTLDMLDADWREADFSTYDIIYHVAGIAHADVSIASDEVKEKYYSVNTDLAVEVARKAKADGVKEFIFMSSMIVYGESASYGKKKVIDEHTVPSPANFYGDSKLQADMGIRELANDEFKVIVLRSPMIYGKGSKGNYLTLAKLAKKLLVFPRIDNERSMLYIENLCELLCQVMLVEKTGRNSVVLLPQNEEWTTTSDMVQEIAKVSGRKVRRLEILNLAVLLGSKVPGKIGRLVNKAFGNSCYRHSVSVYPGIEYQKVSLVESIQRTEGSERTCPVPTDYTRYSVLMSVYSKEHPEYLTQALDSMINQTVVPDEIVLVEDGPLTEPLYAVIEGYKSNYPGLFNIVSLKENGGLGNALNQGIRVCHNELIARMDTDDISKPERCEKQIAAFMDDPKLDIVGTQIDEFLDTPENIISSRVVPSSHEEIVTFSRRRSPFNHPTVMYRKSAVEKMGGYKNYGRKEDLDLFIRMVNEGCKATNLPESYLCYRTNADNLQRRKTWNNCKEYIQIMYGFHRKGYNGLVDIIYVVAGQLLMFLTPERFTKKLSDRYLREKK